MNTQPEQPARKTNRMAKASLILGGCSLLSIGMIVFGFAIQAASMGPFTGMDVFLYGGFFGVGIFGLACLICGIIALVQIRKLARREKGIGMAYTGIVLGSIECALFLVLPAFV